MVLSTLVLATAAFREPVAEPLCPPGLHDGGDGSCLSAGLCIPGFVPGADGRCSGWVEAPSPSGIGPLTVLSDGALLMTGTDFEARRVERFDPATLTWTIVAPMPAPRVAHDAVLLHDGSVLVVGGGRQDTYDVSMADVWRYFPDIDVWRTAGSLAVSRLGQSTVVLTDGRVMVVGGSDPSGGVLVSSEIYDPVSNTWSPAADVAVGRTGAVALPLPGGGMLLHGGDGRDPISDFFVEDSFEVYDPGLNRWDRYETFGRHSHTGLTLHSGAALIAGGNADFGEWWGISQVEVFDPVARAWHLICHLTQERSMGPVVVELADGRVVFAGGLLNDVDLYDPAFGSCLPAAPLPDADVFGDVMVGAPLGAGALVIGGGGQAMRFYTGQ
jgi:N-acetylneuraminic acid mutarotase